MHHKYVFDRFRSRYLVLLWLVGIVFLPGINVILSAFKPTLDWYWQDLSYIYYSHFILFSLVLASIYGWRIPLVRLLGPIPTMGQVLSGLKLTGFTFIFSYAAIYIVFYPISLASEAFVVFWLMDLPPMIYFNDWRWESVPGELEVPLMPNILSFLSVCVFAPIFEEVFFRGLLLHRWAAKWGTWPAIIGTSSLFGILHPDVLGAFVFGVAMCVLYLRTQSLFLLIICHAANNAVAWLMDLGFHIQSDFRYSYTLESFYEQWVYGVVALLVCSIWAISYFRGFKSDSVWKLPLT